MWSTRSRNSTRDGHWPGDKRRCQYLPERTCSALADKLAKTKPAVQADETRLLDLYQAQVEPLKSANASLQKQVQLLMDQLAAAEKAGAETARQSQAHIDDLKVQVERLEAENRDLKSQLSSAVPSRASISLTRDRIRARYLLPGSDSNQ